VALEVRFDLPPESAVAFLEQKGLVVGFAWQDVWQEAHDQAFTVAKMLDTDLLGDVHEMVTRYIEEGRTTAEFVRDLKPELVRRGWWGRAEMVDPETGERRTVQLGSPRRLRVIFETNVKASYAAGHWAEIEATAQDAPYLMYDAIDDGRTRPEHAAWDGTVLRWDDPWWRTHYPPNGWNCRCGVIQLDADELAELGKDGPDKAPAVRTYEWTNPRTGETVRVPEGIDPGWAYHPGRTRAAEVRRVMAEKLDRAPYPLARAAVRSLVQSSDLARWLDDPQGEFPLVALPDEDAAQIGARGHTGRLSAETLAKQRRNHPELTVEDYAAAQDAVDRGWKVKDSRRSLVYVWEEGRQVVAVKATRTGKAIYVTSVRKLSSREAARDREIARLRRKARKP